MVAVQFEKFKDRHPESPSASKRFLQLASRGEGPCVTEMSNCTTAYFISRFDTPNAPTLQSKLLRTRGRAASFLPRFPIPVLAV
jgi:hypothetical protein